MFVCEGAENIEIDNIAVAEVEGEVTKDEIY